VRSRTASQPNSRIAALTMAEPGLATGMVAPLDRALHRNLEGPCAALISYSLEGVHATWMALPKLTPLLWSILMRKISIWCYRRFQEGAKVA
jgi:hypothetical protein